MKLLAIILGGCLLGWPAVLNGYPLVFIDTVSYLRHTTVPELPWDKTQAYGPFLHLFHWQVSLWPALAAQVLIASHIIWLTQRMARGTATPGLHLLVCAALAGLTSAPWFLATLMPDAFTALAPLCLLLLGFCRLSRVETAWVALVGGFAIAVHLSHLPTALAMVALVAVIARRVAPIARALLPVALALAFLLARLQADGPAVEVIRARCPAAGWHLCAFADRMPVDSDFFLWDGASPLNSEADGSPRPMGGERGAADAREIVAATLRDRPVAVLRAMIGNTVAQLALLDVGDTLVDTHLAVSARRPIAAAFPARELAAFDAGLQMRGLLPARAEPFLAAHLPVLVASLAAAIVLLWRAWRARDLGRGALLAGALLAVLANAAATGALSKPHHRYQARIVWLLPLAVFVSLGGRREALRADVTAAGEAPPLSRAG